ncbi:MAG TPA: hypothetical protein VHX43_02805 [Xanthobacteraceae bacterium]|jgi:hypothetical protein|nr:hypothetical protein [Xanthobacteraceae bacterium]
MARAISLSLLGGVAAGVLLSAQFAGPLYAQNAGADDLKSRIINVQIVQRAFAKALAHCTELNGANFYFQPRDRVLDLTDYHRSLDSLALQRAFNPETKRPWSQQDADARWTEVQKEAAQDQANCALVASLPFLQKKLQELQQQAASSQGAPVAISK